MLNPYFRSSRVTTAAAVIGAALLAKSARASSNPILFVTQVPRALSSNQPTDVSSTFGGHLASMAAAGRGGDLWIRYPNGTLKNLTAAAGYGSTDPTGFQGANAIAVRDPSMYWDGTRAVFSMVVGAPTQQHQGGTYYWQLYEITGLGVNQTPVITPVAHQPANANNVSPVYGSDDRIIFVSDTPFAGAGHLTPQFDEYLGTPSTTGLWSLDATAGDLRLLNHAPSGDFTPTVDSFARVVFTQWDHLQRDQRADSDSGLGIGAECNSGTFGTFNYGSEAANAAYDLADRSEVFPEPRICRLDLLAGTPLKGNLFNQFFPWTIRQDGQQGEILNHLGRHELASGISGTRTDDPNIVDYTGQYPRFNTNPINGMFQIKEDPTHAGRYYGVDALEFGTHASGQVISIDAPPAQDADHIAVTYVTHRNTFWSIAQSGNSGHYRDPLPMADGTLVASHAPVQVRESGDGTPQSSNYSFQIKTLSISGNGYYVANSSLTGGINKTLSYWSPDVLVTYTGPMWELNAVEVAARTRPSITANTLPTPEQSIFDALGISTATFQTWLQQHNLALAVSRNVTTRDDLDKQQPFNLRVPGGAQTIGAPGTIYDISYLQFYQGDYIRGMTGGSAMPVPGRRVLAQDLHDPAALAANIAGPGPAGSAALGADGSMAFFLPAGRALSWELTNNSDVPVVRERYWITFQAGEVRVCTSCHGLSQFDQAGHTAPTNPPQALTTLLQHWQTLVAQSPTPTFTTPPTASPTATATVALATPTPTGTVPPAASPTATVLPAASLTPTATPDPPVTATPTVTATVTPALCGSGIVLTNARLFVRSTPLGLRLSGRAVIPKPWLGVDPVHHGIRVRLDSLAGGGAVDVQVPSGPRVNGVGWTVNPKGTRWVYRDAKGIQGPMRSVVVSDRSDVQSGQVRVTLRAAGAAPQALPAVQAVRATLVMGTAGECATALWAAPTSPPPRCVQTVAPVLRCH